MKINTKQKFVIFACWAFFIASVIYVPTEGAGGGGYDFEGFVLLWNFDGAEVALKVIFIEWAAIFVTFIAFFTLSASEV
jgi:hypothetical protein